ncbi:MAG: glycosyltransferase family 2 protein [Bacteroidaceae bacterium]|nr:glycosyltransferase family 2 protein [Bacteroidaceae bacterium]
MWYTKYLEAYEKAFDEVRDDLYPEIRQRLERLQSDKPVVTVSVIAYNEERHLTACLWSLSEQVSKYPMEIIGVDNESKDYTAEIYKRCGVPYYTETRHSCGWARLCGLSNARGRYHLNIDSDTMYPPHYVEMMVDMLEKEDTVGVSSLWSYIPDEQHPVWGLKIYEFCRDVYIWLQHFKRPELSVRGLVFGYKTDLAQQVGIRTDIIRGEDGYLAFQLKEYGKLRFLRNRKARAITGYGTVGADGGLWQSFWLRVKKYTNGFWSMFKRQDKYEDRADNLVG